MLFPNTEWTLQRVTGDTAITGPAKVGPLTINGFTTAPVISIYDGSDATGTLKATIASGSLAQGQVYFYNGNMPDGIFIDLTGGSDIDLTIHFKN